MTISNQSSGIRPGVCTSSTRPTAPYTGMIIYETDTGYLRTWNGSSWDYLSQSQNTTMGLGPAGGLLGTVTTWASNTRTINSSSTTVDLYDQTLSFTANRNYKLNWSFDVYHSAAVQWYLYVYVDTVFTATVMFNNSVVLGTSWVYKPTTTANRRIQLRAVYVSGAGTAYFGSLAINGVWMEDLGP